MTRRFVKVSDHRETDPSSLGSPPSIQGSRVGRNNGTVTQTVHKTQKPERDCVYEWLPL